MANPISTMLFLELLSCIEENCALEAFVAKEVIGLSLLFFFFLREVGPTHPRTYVHYSLSFLGDVGSTRS